MNTILLISGAVVQDSLVLVIANGESAAWGPGYRRPSAAQRGGVVWWGVSHRHALLDRDTHKNRASCRRVGSLAMASHRYWPSTKNDSPPEVACCAQRNARAGTPRRGRLFALV